MRTVSGKYTTRRDGGIEYAYEATWELAEGDWIVWSAEVTRNGAPAGRTRGQVMRPASTDMDAVVRDLVCEAIERRAGLRD